MGAVTPDNALVLMKKSMNKKEKLHRNKRRFLTDKQVNVELSDGYV